jgi:sugar phosphate isomerase/epimerase
MKLSCCAYSFRQDLTAGRMMLEQFLDRAAEIGFEGVELTAYYFPQTDRAYLHHVKREAHFRGLTVSGTAIGTDFAQPDASRRREHVEMARTWIEHSVELGAPTLRVFAGPVREGVSEEEAFGWVAEALRECSAYAGEHGVLLALENHLGLTTTAEQTLKLLDAACSDWVGLNLDFGNFGGDIYAQFAACAPRAVATHAKRHYRGPDGPAPVDYRRVREVLESTGYRGWIAIEYEDPEDPAVAVPEFAAELRRALSIEC